jgi:hypothetical protein
LHPPPARARPSLTASAYALYERLFVDVNERRQALRRVEPKHLLALSAPPPAASAVAPGAPTAPNLSALASAVAFVGDYTALSATSATSSPPVVAAGATASGVAAGVTGVPAASAGASAASLPVDVLTSLVSLDAGNNAAADGTERRAELVVIATGDAKKDKDASDAGGSAMSGYEHMWKIVLGADDESVAMRATLFLNTLHQVRVCVCMYYDVSSGGRLT